MKALVDARRNHIIQLSGLSIKLDRNNDNENSNRIQDKESEPTRPEQSRRQPLASNMPHNKKITDFFSKTSHLDDVHKFSLNHVTRHSISYSCNGFETITLLDSDDEDGITDLSFSSIGQSRSHVKKEPVGGDLKAGESVSEDDLEIVDILPPIPLRDHPVHEID